jgi:hypothetical protein
MVEKNNKRERGKRKTEDTFQKTVKLYVLI